MRRLKLVLSGSVLQYCGYEFLRIENSMISESICIASAVKANATISISEALVRFEYRRNFQLIRLSEPYTSISN